jgi:hypothetical protein
MQRPSATRCCWPPESWRGRRSSSGSMDRIWPATPHRDVDVGLFRPAFAQAEAKLSYTLMC